MSSYGERLTARDLKTFAASWIPAELAEAAGLRRVDSSTGAAIVGRTGNGDYNGILFPYVWPGDGNVRAYRLRRDYPDLEMQADGTIKEKAKYLSAPGQRSMLYFAPNTDPCWLDDVKLPVIVVEGEKKGLALSRLAHHDTPQPRFLVVAIAGVYNWRGIVEKVGGPNGERVDVKGPSPDLDRIKWSRRRIYVCFDSNVATNSYVKNARWRLTKELKRRGARILYVTIPEEDGINGIDDFLAKHGPETALALIEAAREPDITPKGFSVLPDGVYAITDQENLWICSKLEIRALSRSRDNEAWSRLLEFEDADGNQHNYLMPASMLSGDGNTYRAQLLDMGLLVSPNRKARDLLTVYIQTARPDDRVRSVNRIGWQGAAFVLTDETIGDEAGERTMLQIESGARSLIRVLGGLDDWRESISRLCSGNSRLVFAVSSAFASPLLEPVGEDGGGFHFRGPSSLGKSTALRVAGSVWGGGGYDGFLQTWRTTANGLEVIAETHNNALLCLDEISQSDGREVGEIAYQLANGSGKGRMARSGGARRKPEWRLLFLSSGELALVDHAGAAGKRTRGGHEIRFIDIDADAGAGLGLFEDLHGFSSADAFAKYLTESARKCYGSPIRGYLTAIIQNRDALIRAVRNVRADFRARNVPPDASGEVLRVASRFALVGAAGDFATGEGITGWQEGEAVAAAEALFKSWVDRRGTSGNSDAEAGVRQVRAFIESHGSSRFQSENETKVLNRAGFKQTKDGETEYQLLPEAFKREVCAGFDSIAVARELARRGFLRREPGNHLTVRARPPGGSKSLRVYAVSGSVLEVD